MESAEAEEAEADVLVQIPFAGEGGFGVVEVEGFEVGEADCGGEVGEGGSEGGGGAEVVAGGVGVAGVEADADP